MRDSAPNSPEDESKFWMTSDTDTSALFEFEDRDAFRNKRVSRRYQLPFQFDGNSHVVHDGHFYYNQYASNKLVKYDLRTNHTYSRTVEEAVFQPASSRLYESRYSFMDIMTDENGLWLIFASNTTNTLILKLDAHSLDIENAWNVSVDQRSMGEMVIACGILYGIHSSSDTFTKIRFAFDLFLNVAVPVNLNFTNPFSRNNFVSYNPHHEKIYAWDSRNLIEYPVRFSERSPTESRIDVTADPDE